jgi:dTDP-L-rhamnose 4-epimerase
VPEKVLVTGGEGFIGSQIVDLLVAEGHEVRVVDSLHPAAHSSRPTYLNPAAEYVEVDISSPGAIEGVLDGIDAVSHQAAMVGLGKDFGDAEDYVLANSLGTARLLSALSRREFAGPLVLASSMVVYGEGGYDCELHGPVRPLPRSRDDLERGLFEPRCPICARSLSPRTVAEDANTDPRSVYAATKLNQEHLCALYARDNPKVSFTALRYHNVYGPRMPRDTPYAGVASIFRSAPEAGEAPAVFEDGEQLRDFVHVTDVARANLLALRAPPDLSGIYNVASGRPRRLIEMATLLAAATGPGAPGPIITGEFRLGDVRHVFADARKAADRLGFSARIDLEGGMNEFASAELR